MAVHENKGVSVEFHPQWEHLYSPVANARYQEMCRESGMISKELYLVSLILHLQRHFLERIWTKQRKFSAGCI